MLLLFAGCHSYRHNGPKLMATPLPPPEMPRHVKTPLPPPDMPRELSKVALPIYRVEPPDILVVEAIHVVPRSPYLLRTSDLLGINVANALPEYPVSGQYAIQPGGLVNLGMPYGTVRVNKLTVEQAQDEIQRVMSMHLKDPVVSVSLIEMSGKQQIAGQHLVGPDGTITLGSYGSVPVVGLTLAEAKEAIEAHLSRFLDDPEVSVDVFAYNSKVYYVITEGAGLGDGVSKFPITGNETVLDAIAQINGLPDISSKRIWVARPTPDNDMTILSVDWKGVTAEGAAGTNFQIMPGDRIFVAEDKLVAFDTHLEKTIAPLQRAMGFTLLGVSTAGRLSGKVLQNARTNGGFGGGGVF
jgi:protein involved in polysaccharide export with SLBB domain